MIDYTTPQISALDQLVSWQMRRGISPQDTLFNPNTLSFRALHSELFGESEFAFAAWIYRTIALRWGVTQFAPAYLVPELMEVVFTPERLTVWSILAWTIEVIGYIHPFLDGNRRTTWIYTNRWLQSLGYAPIDWDRLRPDWERSIQEDLSLPERLIELLELLASWEDLIKTVY